MVVPLARVFAQQPPIATVVPLLDKSTSLEAQVAIIEALDGLDDRFREQILRHLVRIIEQKSSDQEISEELWEAYYALKTPAAIRKLKDPTDSVLRYDLPHNQHIRIHEDRGTLVQGGGTGHRTWESSLALTEYLCSSEILSSGDKVIELGAGTGLIGMAIAKLGLAKTVWMTDGSPQLIVKLEKSVAENCLESSVRTSVLQWEDLPAAAQFPKGAVVVAGDVLYGLPALYHIILDCLAELQPSKVILANPIRNAEAYENFKQLCRQRGISVNVLARYSASSVEESDWMFLVSLPPIPLEIIELKFSHELMS